MIYQSGLYLHDVAVLKRYGDRKFKLTYFKQGLRQKGFESKIERRTGVNDEKLDVNISRARSKVFEYGYCNEWDYFVTLTIDKRKYDRTDLKQYYKDFAKFLNNYSRSGNKVNYLFIPELHKDGHSWHMHGFISGLPPEELTQNKNGYLEWKPYRDRFGYMSIDKIRSREGAARYITKYVNKALQTSVKDVGAHLYYCSKGLKVAEEIKRGTLTESIPFNFENDYVKIAWFNDFRLSNMIN